MNDSKKFRSQNLRIWILAAFMFIAVALFTTYFHRSLQGISDRQHSRLQEDVTDANQRSAISSSFQLAEQAVELAFNMSITLTTALFFSLAAGVISASRKINELQEQIKELKARIEDNNV